MLDGVRIGDIPVGRESAVVLEEDMMMNVVVRR